MALMELPKKEIYAKYGSQEAMKLYSICGVYWWEDLSIQVAFSGHFKCDSKGTITDGRICDLDFLSSIEGKMEENELSFAKTYLNGGENKGDTIQYKFKKKGDIYVGKFGGFGGFKHNEGHAQCKVHPTLEDAFWISTSDKEIDRLNGIAKKISKPLRDPNIPDDEREEDPFSEHPN